MVKYTYIICIASLFTGALYSCTGISIKAKDGTTVYARTLEFAQELHSEVLYTPSGYTFEGQTPFKDVKGLTWTSKYAIVGINGLGFTGFIDGINEEGLAGGVFYFPGYAVYSDITPENADKSVASWQVLAWILSTCKTLDEVK
jgi:choloylglycine hydrolase